MLTVLNDPAAGRSWLRVLAGTWVHADVPEAKADLLHAIYDRVIVSGRSIVAARLTSAASCERPGPRATQIVMARPVAAVLARILVAPTCATTAGSYKTRPSLRL